MGVIKKRIGDLLPGRFGIPEMAQAEETGVGRAFIEALDAEIQAVQRDLRTNPRIVTDGDIRDDFRYKTGFWEALEFVRAFPEEARKYIHEKTGGQ